MSRRNSIGVARLLLAVVALPAAAQEFRFRDYGPADGLPAGHIFTILQDQTGYLWLAGARGVFQFDGHTFRHWTQGVPGGRAHAMRETPDGRIWVVASQGVAYRNPGAAEFRRVDIPVQHNARLTRAIAASSEGRLLLGEGNTLWSLGWKNDQLDIQSYAAPGPLRAVTVDSAGRTWAICGSRLCRFDRHGLSEERSTLPEQNWLALAAGPDGRLAARSEAALWVRDGDGAAFRALESPGAVTPFYADLAYSAEGDLLANTTKGISLYRAGAWRAIGMDNGLPTRMITALHIDRENSVWLGTGSEPSLIRWDRRAPWSTYTHAQGLDEETVWGVARDSSGAIWASGSSGVFRMTPGERFSAVSASANEYCRHLASAPDGSVWALINRSTVRRFSGASTRDFALPARSLNYLLLDRQRRLWAIGDHVFRTRADVTSGDIRFEHLEPLATDQNEDFTQASLDPAGRVFMAGTNGLAIFDPAQSTWQRLGTKDGLQSLRLLGVLADSSGYVWVSYRQPLAPTRLVFIADGWQVDRPNLPGELSRTLIVGFAEDLQKRIWVTTEAGVFSWNRSRWRRYRRDEGLRSEDAVAGAVLAATDGSIWVGTTRGLAWFDPQEPQFPVLPPPSAVITGLQVNGHDLRFGPRSLSYWREAEQLYLYRLQGRRFFGTVFDSGWQETSVREVRYEDLPGGAYRLEVKARNAEQVWSPRPAEHVFEMRIPWYASTWFGVAAFTGVPALAYFARRAGGRRRLAAESLKRRQLEDEVIRRTDALADAQKRAEAADQHKSELLAAMSDQVRGPLHAFLGLTQLALTARDDAKRHEYLQNAHESAEALLGTAGDTLDYADLLNNRLRLDFAACDLAALVRAIAKQAQMDCRVAPDVPRFVRADRRRMRQVLLTLVDDATARGGAAGLDVQNSQNGLRFTVEGAELPAAATLARRSLAAQRSGLRFALALQLAELMGGRLTPTTEPAGVAFTVPLAVVEVQSGGNPRVLLLDLPPQLQRSLAAQFEESGVAVASGGLADAGAFPMVVVGAGQIPAIRAAERAARRPRSYLVAVLTSGEPKPDEADDALPVPIDREQLQLALRNGWKAACLS